MNKMLYYQVMSVQLGNAIDYNLGYLLIDPLHP